jgi:hypothetical protein
MNRIAAGVRNELWIKGEAEVQDRVRSRRSGNYR